MSTQGLKERQESLEDQVCLLELQLKQAQNQIHQEKAGKRKIFHSLVKIANELKRARQESAPLMEANEYANQPWYEGGIWRNQVQVLPGVARPQSAQHMHQRSRGVDAVSLSDLFSDLVIVTAFTRVGQAVSSNQGIDLATLLYFAVFFNIWSKEASYSSRFDTSDLSAKMSTLVTCFAVLFGSLSASAPLESTGATRIMMVAAFVAILNCLLHVRIAIVFAAETANDIISAAAPPKSRQSVIRVQDTRHHVRSYATFNIVMTLLEASVWIMGIVVFPEESHWRWAIFALGILLALRVPRAFLANDFHGTYYCITCLLLFELWTYLIFCNHRQRPGPNEVSSLFFFSGS
jgi:Bacterial low temperature requirement A protein (LtrA)